jgi:hypothetical protein
MGPAWAEFSKVFEDCLALTNRIPQVLGAWEGARADENLIKAMEPWFQGKEMDLESASSLPDNFLSLWDTHIQSKMFYKLFDDSDPSAEVMKKKFWSGGREGIAIIAVGLRWAWWKLHHESSTGVEADWEKLVKSVAGMLTKVLEKAKG